MKINEITGKKQAIALKYPSQERVIDILFQNIQAGFNTILYGKGGYGKTDLTKAICLALHLPTITIQCSKDMAKEEFIGPVDMDLYLNKAQYRHNFKASPFMQPGVLILEEFMDVDSDTAVVIKDILSEKGNRYRDTFTKYKIQAVVVTGNKSPAEAAIDESTKALYFERFVSHLDMTWQIHSPEKYIQLFKYNNHSITDDLKFIAQLCAKVKISPRAALQAAKYKDIKSLASLHFFNDLDLNHLIHLYYDQQYSE